MTTSKLIKIAELDKALNGELAQLQFAKSSPYALIKYIKAGKILPLIGESGNCNDIQLAINEIYKHIKFEDCNRYIYFGQPSTEQLLENFKQGEEIFAIIDYSDDSGSKLLYDELFDRVLFKHKLDDSFTNLVMSMIHGFDNLNKVVVNAMKLAALNHTMSIEDAVISKKVYDNLGNYLTNQPINGPFDREYLFDVTNLDEIDGARLVVTLDPIDGYNDISMLSYEFNADVLIEYNVDDQNAKLYAKTPYGYKFILGRYFDVVHQNGLKFNLMIDEIESIGDLIKILNGTYNELNRDPFDENEYEECCDYYIRQFGLADE